MIAASLRSLGHYARSAPLPLAMALGAGALAWGLVELAGWLASGGRAWAAALAGAWAAGCTLVSLASLADGLSRFREFQRIHCLILRYGWQARIIRPVSRSRCQRDAARLASAEAGCLAQTSAYLRQLGYRWYHLMPDLVVDNPRNLLTRRFWRSVLIPRQAALVHPACRELAGRV